MALAIDNRNPRLPASAVFEQLLREHLGDSVRGTFFEDRLSPLLLSSTAKLLRPRLVFIFGTLSRGSLSQGSPAHAEVDALAEIGASAELIHAASLVHDDVVDESDQRRGKPSLHRLTGTQVAVLAGDHLLAQALRLTARHGARLVDAAARAMAAMSEAAASEVALRSSRGGTGPSWVGPAAIRRIAAGKTGALFSYCMGAGPLLVDDTARAEAWSRAGEHLGVAFQFADDLLDLIGGAGKPRGKDLEEGNPNAVLTAAWEAGEVPPALEGLLKSRKWAEACDCLLATRAPSIVQGWIAKELELARGLLGQAASEPKVVEIFERIVEKIVQQAGGHEK